MKNEKENAEIKYVSTRGQGEAVSFKQALLSGLAPDGGLYLPTRIPTIEQAEWQSAASFQDMALRILNRWLSAEVAENALKDIVDDALSFPVPLVSLHGAAWQGVHVLELFHGPTLSFKDFGARTMARLMSLFLAHEDEPLTILVATSGDTGSAVADGFAGQEGIRVVLLYPQGQVSPVQEQQLIVKRPGVQVFAVEGTFDDCQRLVKEAFAHPDLQNLRLSSANSINMGRLLPQMLYYCWAMHQCAAEEMMFCVPSGNLGNLTAGVLATLSGLPVNGFIAAHNANDFFPRYLQHDDVSMGASVRTHSNAMDVGAPSNFERLETLLQPEQMRSLIMGVSVDDDATIQAMQGVFRETGYVADPHTAVGLEAVRRYRERTGVERRVVVLATAHPAKFPETVRQALGQRPETPPQLAAFWDRETATTSLPADISVLSAYLHR